MSGLTVKGMPMIKRREPLLVQIAIKFGFVAAWAHTRKHIRPTRQFRREPPPPHTPRDSGGNGSCSSPVVSEEQLDGNFDRRNRNRP
jgi:hypothetical protein